MKITLLVVGQTEEPYLRSGIEKYLRRLRHYVAIEIKTVPALKKPGNLPEEAQKKKEGESILSFLSSSKTMVLLDEKGETITSRAFAEFVQKKMASGLKELIFVIGGPYGFSNDVYNIAMEKISVSRMTFPHQLVRLIFLEQLYRAFTILKGEPYHHD